MQKPHRDVRLRRSRRYTIATRRKGRRTCPDGAQIHRAAKSLARARLRLDDDQPRAGQCEGETAGRSRKGSAKDPVGFSDALIISGWRETIDSVPRCHPECKRRICFLLHDEHNLAVVERKSRFFVAALLGMTPTRINQQLLINAHKSERLISA